MNTAQTTTRKRKPKVKPLAVMETVNCSVCGSIGSTDDTIEFDGKYLCSDCLDYETVVCERCLARVWIDDNAGDYAGVVTTATIPGAANVAS